MAIRTPTVLSICTGAGGLDLGFGLAHPDARTVCYVEREAFPVVNLVAAMEANLLDAAPLWDDLRTFDGGPWRGVVDWLIGGIPCQPHSRAGKRKGAADERNLWPDARRVIEECRPSAVFLENVAGIERYYFDSIGPELRGLGYRIEEGLFSAEEVGAPHIRERLFVLGYADRQVLDFAKRGMEGHPLREGGRDDGSLGAGAPGDQPATAADGPLAHSGGDGGVIQDQGMDPSQVARYLLPNQTSRWPTMTVSDADETFVDRRATRNSRELPGCGRRQWGRTVTRGQGAAPPGRSQSAQFGEDVAHGDGVSGSMGLFLGGPGETQHETGRGGASVPHSHRIGRQGVRRAEQGPPQQELGSLFPPGPGDLESWARVLAEMPEIEPAFCSLADGVAWWLDATAQTVSPA